jgi:hypothetical protein|tara:strand:- start:17 stop:277 length:261 start_codon:yes stop_codon:yes gene_type:complete
MDKKEILKYLEMISSELTDAYHLTDTDSTVDANCYVSTAQELVDELTHRIENNVTISDKEKHDFNEAINGDLMGPDGLPLNFPYHE